MWVVVKDCVLPPDGKIPETGNTFTTKGGYFSGDIKPKKSGSAGIGLRQRISEETELGFYYLRYNERVPMRDPVMARLPDDDPPVLTACKI